MCENIIQIKIRIAALRPERPADHHILMRPEFTLLDKFGILQRNAIDIACIMPVDLFPDRHSAPAYYMGKEAAESNVDQFTERYSRQPHEIAAQYMSLVSMRSCLPSLWQEIENEDGKVVKGSPEYRDQKAAKYTDRMICAYVNHHMRRKSEFVHRPFPFTSVDTLDSAASLPI